MNNIFAHYLFLSFWAQESAEAVPGRKTEITRVIASDFDAIAPVGILSQVSTHKPRKFNDGRFAQSQ